MRFNRPPYPKAYPKAHPEVHPERLPGVGLSSAPA